MHLSSLGAAALFAVIPSVVYLRQDGTILEGGRARPYPGDMIIVLPKVGVRSLEVARGITQILFQIAVVAQVVLDL